MLWAHAFETRSSRVHASVTAWAGMGHEPPKWSNAVDEFKERIESAKAAAIGAVVGSVAFAPLDLVTHFSNIPQWEFNTDMAAVQGALFAVVYR